MPVTDGIDDDKLEALARDKGVGAFVKPASQPMAIGEGGTASSTARRPTPKLPKPEADAATPRSEMKTLNLELPAYVWTELKIRAAQRQTSLKHVAMTAFLKDGITIYEVDMIEDGRRLR